MAGPPSPDGALSGGPKPRSHGSHTQECLECLPDEGLAGALGLHLAVDAQGLWGLQGLQLSRGDLGVQVEGWGLGAARPWLSLPCRGLLCLHCRVTREGLCDRGAQMCNLAGSHRERSSQEDGWGGWASVKGGARVITGQCALGVEGFWGGKEQKCFHCSLQPAALPPCGTGYSTSLHPLGTVFFGQALWPLRIPLHLPLEPTMADDLICDPQPQRAWSPGQFRVWRIWP